MAQTTATKDDKKPQEAADTAAPEAPALKDSSTDSLAKAFKTLSERAHSGLKEYRGTLARLGTLVAKFHAIGLDQVGVELATFDHLREYNLMNRPGSEDHSLYSILSIYDARFLIRLQPDMKIVTYTENLNKPAAGVQYMDTDEFWYRTERSSGGSLKVLKNEPKFNVYDLTQEADVVNFLTAVAETTAALSANETLRAEDAPAKSKRPVLAKNTAGLKPKI